MPHAQLTPSLLTPPPAHRARTATVVIFGTPISDPIALLSRVQGALPALAALLGLTLATLTTNIAANVVAPANALIAAAPGRVSFVGGAVATAVLGLLVRPWTLVSSTNAFFFLWLNGCSGEAVANALPRM